MTLAIVVLFASAPALAGNNAVNDACKRLCNAESDCVHRCVAQAELFELRSDFINAITDFTKGVDDRMRALRSGADLTILSLCKTTGWSLDNMMICLRSYPTPEVIKNCKRLSPRQEEQVECVRLGKSEAEIDACIRLVPGSDRRLQCLGLRVTANETANCGEAGGDSYERMKCLERNASENADKIRRRELDMRVESERRKRMPASSEN
jgi:hypothetical protein